MATLREPITGSQVRDKPGAGGHYRQISTELRNLGWLEKANGADGYTAKGGGGVRQRGVEVRCSKVAQAVQSTGNLTESTRS